MNPGYSWRGAGNDEHEGEEGDDTASDNDETPFQLKLKVNAPLNKALMWWKDDQEETDVSDQSPPTLMTTEVTSRVVDLSDESPPLAWTAASDTSLVEDTFDPLTPRSLTSAATSVVATTDANNDVADPVSTRTEMAKATHRPREGPLIPLDHDVILPDNTLAILRRPGNMRYTQLLADVKKTFHEAQDAEARKDVCDKVYCQIMSSGARFLELVGVGSCCREVPEKDAKYRIKRVLSYRKGFGLGRKKSKSQKPIKVKKAATSPKVDKGNVSARVKEGGGEELARKTSKGKETAVRKVVQLDRAAITTCEKNSTKANTTEGRKVDSAKNAQWTMQDVLPESSPLSATHAGNSYYRFLVRQHRDSFQVASTYAEKARIAGLIYDSVAAKGGKFLLRVDGDDYLPETAVDAVCRIMKALDQKKRSRSSNANGSDFPSKRAKTGSNALCSQKRLVKQALASYTSTR